jgi:hypothetical protein
MGSISGEAIKLPACELVERVYVYGESVDYWTGY